MISVSFIIPHMGREGLLIDTLKSITKLDTNNFAVSVIVASKNKTFSNELLAFQHDIDVSFITMPMNLTISDQRNFGVKESKGDYLAFIDADIALSSNWLQQMYSILTSERAILSSAVQVPCFNASPLEHVRTLLSNVVVDTEMEFLPGRNLFLSRETFSKSGGFPSELVTCEDYVFTQRVSKLGKLFYSSKSNYVHLGEDKKYWEMAKKEVWRGQSNLASISGRSIPLSEYPSFVVPPIFTFACLFAVIGLFFQLHLLSALCLVCICIVLSAYTIRLWRKSSGQPSLLAIVQFYGLYFPARTIGTILGALRPFKTGDHS